jgi:Gpi18-like mannosyltransferase
VRAGYWVAHGITPYASLPPAPGLSFAEDFGAGANPAIAYLPFWPLLLGALYKFYILLGSPSRFVYYFLLKQPVIICDVLVGYSLYQYLDRRGSPKARFALKVWLFSPFMIIVSAIWGMFDAIPVLFVILALTARPGAYRGTWEGLATFAKSIPVIYTIPLSRGPNPLRNLALSLGIPIVATLVTIQLTGWSFSIFSTTVQSAIPTSRFSLSVWGLPFYLNTIGVLPNSDMGFFAWAGYIWVAGVAVATVLAYKWFGFNTERGMVQSLLLITLTFLVLRGQVNEQYSLYLFAPALLDVAMWSPQRTKLVLASIATVTAYHLTNVVLLIRYVTPAYENALAVEAGIISKINAERNAGLFIAGMVFWIINVVYFYQLYKERHLRTEDVPLAPAGVTGAAAGGTPSPGTPARSQERPIGAPALDVSPKRTSACARSGTVS